MWNLQEKIIITIILIHTYKKVMFAANHDASSCNSQAACWIAMVPENDYIIAAQIIQCLSLYHICQYTRLKLCKSLANHVCVWMRDWPLW